MGGKWICLVAVVSLLNEAAHAQGKQAASVLHDVKMAP